MCVQNIMEIALCVHEFRHLVQNGALPQTLESNRNQWGRSMTNLKKAAFLSKYVTALCKTFVAEVHMRQLGSVCAIVEIGPTVPEISW